MKFSRSFFTSKTTWAAFATICTAIAGAVHGDLTPLPAALSALAALMAAFLRDTHARGWEALLEAIAAMSPADGGEVKP